MSNRHSGEMALAELRVWKIPKSKEYPAGVKYSLFLVRQGSVLVGMDNHKPKGPHLHLGDEEVSYDFKGIERLLEDFWDFARKAGFEP